MTLPLINFASMYADGNKPAVFLGYADIVQGVPTWYDVSVFTAADIAPGNTGWATIQTNQYGVLRSVVEANTVDPVPTLFNREVSHVLTMFIYPDGSTSVVKGVADATEGATGFIGMVEVTYAATTYQDGSIQVTDAQITDVVGPF